MALVLALLLTTLCGVHAASIPSKSLDLLASKSDNKLENLDQIRRSVLEDMKSLLDNQLAALFESAVTRKAESQRKRLKPKTKSHPTIRTGETTSDVESIIPEEPEELIKVLTDDSLQDPSDEMLRDAVDQLLQEDESGKADNIDNSEVYNNENQLNGSNSGNSEEVFGDDAFDDASLPIYNTDNDRRKGKSNKKGISHVIIEHIPKSNKNNDDKNVEDILDLDKILKSALKDSSGYLSQEDENSRDGDNEEGDSGTTNHYSKSSHKKEALFTNSSDTGLRMHDPEDSGLQFVGTNNVDVDENTIRTENQIKNNQDSDRNGETDTRQNSTNNDDYKTNHHKHIHHHRKKSKGRQPINYDVSDENHTLIGDDTNRAGKDFNKDDNDTKDFKLGENEMKKDHEERQHPYKKSKNRYSKTHSNKNHHSKHRSRNHDKHKHHNDNEPHDHSAKGHHLIVRLISDSDGSNESKMGTMHDTTTHKKMGHSVSSDFREGHQDSKKIYNRDGNDDSSESRKNAINEENASRDDDKDKKNLTEIEDINSKKEERTVIARDDDTEEDESHSREDELNERHNVTEENSREVDNEQITREGNPKTGETERGMEKKNTDNENKYLIEKDRSVADSENDAINSTKTVPIEKNRAREETDDTEAKKDNASEEEEVTEKDKRLKNDESHKCHHEKIGIENDEINLIHDLLLNKEMKKSYALSLTLSTK